MIQIDENVARETIERLEQQFKELIENAQLRQQAAAQIPTLVARANQVQGALGVWRDLLGEPEAEDVKAES